MRLVEADEFLAGVPSQHVRIGSFRESYFPSEWAAAKDWFEEIKAKFDPEIVFTHYREDRHRDRRGLVGPCMEHIQGSFDI
jgi:LmbE family N-acetylglucosaminyl deacetylase